MYNLGDRWHLRIGLITSLSDKTFVQAIDARNEQSLHETDVVRDLNQDVGEDADDIGGSMYGGLSETQLLDHRSNYR